MLTPYVPSQSQFANGMNVKLPIKYMLILEELPYRMYSGHHCNHAMGRAEITTSETFQQLDPTTTYKHSSG